MEVIDFHSHFFSRPFFDALAAQSPLHDPLGMIAKETPIEVPPDDTDAHLARWTAEMDRKGVTHLVTFASLPEEIPAVGEAAARSDGRITPIALVDPRAEPDIASLIDEQGFGGVLVFPAMHHFRIGAQQELLERLDERGAILFLHCGLLVVKLRDLLGLPRPYDLRYANPLDVIPAANRYRNVSFVIPHFGAGFLRETLMAGTQCQNVYIDTSSTNSWVVTQAQETSLRDVFERSLGVFGTERILFGTDSNVFPDGWRNDRLDLQKAILDDIGLSDLEQEAIFSGNARRLLGM